jgi:hypothetical protein
MQQLDRKTNQQITYALSSGADTLDNPMKGAWSATALATVHAVRPTSPEGSGCLPHEPDTPVRTVRGALAGGRNSRLTTADSAVIDVTPGSVL